MCLFYELMNQDNAGHRGAHSKVIRVTLVKEHGLQYLLATTLLTGVLQILIGWAGFAKMMRFVSRSVITGFANALAILIFLAQLPELVHVPWTVYVLVAAGLAIIYLFPYATKAIPSPLVAIVLLTTVTSFWNIHVPTVGDKGQLPHSLPFFLLPDIPMNWDTLRIIFPVSLALSIVGLLESMMTATLIDDFTDTSSNKRRSRPHNRRSGIDPRRPALCSRSS